MIEHIKNIESEIINLLILKSPFLKDLGLITGKMGIALMFHIYGNRKQSHIYSDFANELLIDIWDEINSHIKLNFMDGLCGIGWSIEYLAQNYYIEGNTNEICGDIDLLIQNDSLTLLTENIVDLNLEDVLLYVKARELGAFQLNKQSPFKHVFLEELKYRCNKSNIRFNLNDVLSLNTLMKFIPEQGEINLNTIYNSPLGLNGLSGFLLNKLK